MKKLMMFALCLTGLVAPNIYGMEKGGKNKHEEESQAQKEFVYISKNRNDLSFEPSNCDLVEFDGKTMDKFCMFQTEKGSAWCVYSKSILDNVARIGHEHQSKPFDSKDDSSISAVAKTMGELSIK
jgi:hypothetical protein